jgi:predicted N-acetyltransferase YhbS
VARARVNVRPVSSGDLDALGPLWEDFLRSFDPGPTPGGASAVHRARARWESRGDDPSHRTVVAWDGDEPLGVAALSAVEIGPWSGTVVLVSLLHVRDGARRRGVGHALLVEALSFAERIGADQVAVDVPPHLRDANRYFARLGFGPVVTRRVATTTALRRRLLGEAAPQRGRLAGLRARARRGHTDAPAVTGPVTTPVAPPSPAPGVALDT